MPRAPQFDVTEARALWDAQTPVLAMAKRLGVGRNAIYRYAERNGWPARESTAGVRRVPVRPIYPCIRCGAENTVTRRTIRCRSCSAIHRKERQQFHNAECRNPLGVRRWRGLPIATTPTRPVRLDGDPDIAAYRAEKAARVKLGPADDFAEARLQLRLLEAAAKPKRGRPKQSIGRAEHARKVA